MRGVRLESPTPEMDRSTQLMAMSLALGDPTWGLAILAEGNTSCRTGEDEFMVKASGHSMQNISPAGFVRCRQSTILEAMAGPGGGDDWVRDILIASKADNSDQMPSTEAFMHAFLLSLPGIEFVGHTHPPHVNGLLCAKGAELNGRLFPDHVVCCGPKSCIVPYTDPGLALALAVQLHVEEFVRLEVEVPRCILIENHGLIAIGARPEEVLSCTFMAEKAARIQIAACAAGGPRFMPQEQIERIHKRPDEAYRRELIGKMARRADGGIESG